MTFLNKDAAAYEQLDSRLFNWKFAAATQYLQGQPSHVVHLIEVLAAKYGNLGWIDEENEKDLADEGVTASEVILLGEVLNALIG